MTLPSSPLIGTADPGVFESPKIKQNVLFEYFLINITKY